MKCLIPLFVCWLSVPAMASSDLPAHIKSCFDCHGEQGVSIEKDMPTIAGLSATFIEDSMYAYIDQTRPAASGPYRAGDTSRPHTDMVRLSKPLSDQQISEMASWYARQPFVAARQSYDPKQVGAGKKLHLSQCESCHEAAGSVAADDAGLLAGQWTSYLRESIVQYRDKSRQTNKKMAHLLTQLTPQQIEALLNYYASNTR